MEKVTLQKNPFWKKEKQKSENLNNHKQTNICICRTVCEISTEIKILKNKNFFRKKNINRFLTFNTTNATVCVSDLTEKKNRFFFHCSLEDYVYIWNSLWKNLWLARKHRHSTTPWRFCFFPPSFSWFLAQSQRIYICAVFNEVLRLVERDSKKKMR